MSTHTLPTIAIMPTRWAPLNTRWRDYPDREASPQAIWRVTQQVAIRAGIAAHVDPHVLRHAFWRSDREARGPAGSSGASRPCVGATRPPEPTSKDQDWTSLPSASKA